MGTFVGFVAAAHALHAALTLGAWLDGVALQAVLLASGLMAAISASVPRCRADVVLDEASALRRAQATRGPARTASCTDRSRRSREHQAKLIWRRNVKERPLGAIW